MIRRATLAAAAAALLALGAAEAASAADRCKPPRGSERLATSSYTLVYRPTSRSAAIGPTYACNRRTGRRFKLDDPANLRTVVGGGGDDGPQPAGTHLAYEIANEGGEGIAWSLYTLDLATAKKRRLGTWSDENDEVLVAYHLVRSGAIAWTDIWSLGETGRVWLRGENGTTLLDQGDNELGMTFAVSSDGRRVFWMNGDQPKSALVR